MRLAEEETRFLAAVGVLEPRSSAELLPLVYEELRRLAQAHVNNEHRPQTLQATDLVHEAYLRLRGPQDRPSPIWDSRGHFFAAAAMAMRRVLIGRARARGRLKRGGGMARQPLDDAAAVAGPEEVDLLSLDEALTKLEREAPEAAHVVMLRYFAGLGLDETAEALGISRTTVKARWNFAKAWLHREMGEDEAEPGG